MEIEIPDGGYNVVLVDPPWSYQNWTEKKHGAAKAHYDGLEFEELAQIPVQKWVSASSVMMLWATWPKLDDAMALISEWEFKYVTGIPWIKTVPSSGEIKRGVGFWSQGASEMLLIAKRLKFKSNPNVETQIGLLINEPVVFYAPTRGHSQKPLDLYGWIEQKCPGPRLELFATDEHDGWTAWGTDLGFELGSYGVRIIEKGRDIPQAVFDRIVSTPVGGKAPVENRLPAYLDSMASF